MNDNIYAGICPACKSDNVFYQNEFLKDDYLIFPATCGDCKTSFEESYYLDFSGSEITGKAIPEEDLCVNKIK